MLTLSLTKGSILGGLRPGAHVPIGPSDNEDAPEACERNYQHNKNMDEWTSVSLKTFIAGVSPFWSISLFTSLMVSFSCSQKSVATSLGRG